MRTTEPTQITTGEEITWTKSFSGFPASEWTLQYRYRGPGAGFNIDAVAQGSAFVSTITTTNSGGMAPGQYLWQAWMTEIADSTNKEMVLDGTVRVIQGFSATDTADIDLRSPAKQAYDALFAALLGSASNDQLEFEVSTPAGSTRVQHMSRKEMTDMLSFYAKIVRRENLRDRVKKGEPLMQPINVRLYDA